MDFFKYPLSEKSKQDYLTKFDVLNHSHLKWSPYSWFPINGATGVMGTYNGYEAQYNFPIHQGEGWNNLRFLYKIKLKKNIHVPFIFRDRIEIDDHIELNNNGWWLTLVDISPHPWYIYLDKQTDRSIMEKFDFLIEYAKKIQSGEIPMKDIIEKQKKKFLKDVFILIFVLVIFCLVGYLVIVNSNNFNW